MAMHTPNIISRVGCLAVGFVLVIKWIPVKRLGKKADI